MSRLPQPGRLRPLVRSLGGRVRRVGVGVAIRAQRTTHRRGQVPGLLSIVVPAYQVEDYLDECLTSLRFQHYRRVEIIVVDDGSPDRSGDIARAHRRRDLRVIVVRRPNGGLSAARNTGVRHARGEYLTFVDSDDVVAVDAYTSAIGALEESGSDFAVNLYDRLEVGRSAPAGVWIRKAHLDRRLGETLRTFPEAMVNAVAWSKTYRRAFWDDAGLEFPEGKLYEDQPVSMAAFAKASGFDVLPEIGVSWRIRTDRSSISQRSWSSENLAAHNETVRSSLAAIRDEGLDDAAETRALQLLANNMPFFTRHLITADDEYWELLRVAIGDLVGNLPRERYTREVAAQDKVLYELIISGRQDDAATFLENFGHDMRRFRTEHTPAGFRAHLPMSEGLPDDVTVLSDRQLRLLGRAMRMSWRDDGALEIAGWACIRFIDLAIHPPKIGLALVGPDGSRIPFDVTEMHEPRVDVLTAHWYCDFTPGGFEAVLPAERVPTTEGRWYVEVSLTAADVTRNGPLEEVSYGGGAGVAHSRVDAGGRLSTVRMDRNRVMLRISQAPTHATAAAVDATGQLVVDLVSPGPMRSVSLGHRDRPQALGSVTPTSTGPDSWQARLPLRDGAPADVPIQVWAETGDKVEPLLAPPSVPASPGVVGADTGRVVSCSPTGQLELADRLPVATEVEIEDDRLAVRVRSGAPMEHWTPVLHTPADQIVGHFEPTAANEGLLVFPLTRSKWGYDELGLRSGKYAVSLMRDDQMLPVTPSPALLATLSHEQLTARYRVTAEVFVNEPVTLAFNLQPPLADDERGERNQRRLREETQVEVADRDAVFFRALYGEAANCNGLGVHEELRRRGVALPLYWSVNDHSIPLPEGAVPLIEGTRTWHEVVFSARYHMVNVHQLYWFSKPPGQVLIETMHGYPYKVMGHEWWRKGDFSGSQIKNYDRRARDWDYFVSPATYATPLLKAAFLDPAGAEPEILEIGYPRNDVLLSARAGEIREATREMLGIRPGQTAVMYAPTFRDYLSADDLAAQRVDFFDVGEASRLLGEDVVILVRGHAFNARAEDRLLSDSKVIDVTDHPDVNDLILASDVAVLDYSSLRFDYALTDKPMIFLVPDLEKYDAVRGGVIDYAPTAPGPHVATTRDVVRHVGRLDEVAAEYADARARFRKEYTDLDDGHAAARLVDAVFVPRGDAPAS